MNNTKISYQYRDASNYKYGEDVVVRGTVTLDQLMAHVDDEDLFIASEAGLPSPQVGATGFPSEDDHVFCELLGAEPTADEPTIEVTAEGVLAAFQKANGQWDVATAAALLGLES